MAAVTKQLAAYCASLDYAALPPAVQERTRFLVLDLVGNILRGRHDAESTPPLLAGARAMGVACGNSAVFGDCARY
ncbi:MAG: MmgE/PrpD family protein, partial [Acetobacteraceae bacterium]|nr:MmgE/PrpD family protein [Acetobacteraceae bacterium]